MLNPEIIDKIIYLEDEFVRELKKSCPEVFDVEIDQYKAEFGNTKNIINKNIDSSIIIYFLNKTTKDSHALVIIKSTKDSDVDVEYSMSDIYLKNKEQITHHDVQIVDRIIETVRNFKDEFEKTNNNIVLDPISFVNKDNEFRYYKSKQSIIIKNNNYYAKFYSKNGFNLFRKNLDSPNKWDFVVNVDMSKGKDFLEFEPVINKFTKAYVEYTRYQKNDDVFNISGKTFIDVDYINSQIRESSKYKKENKLYEAVNMGLIASFILLMYSIIAVLAYFKLPEIIIVLGSAAILLPTIGFIEDKIINKKFAKYMDATEMMRNFNNGYVDLSNKAVMNLFSYFDVKML